MKAQKDRLYTDPSMLIETPDLGKNLWGFGQVGNKAFRWAWRGWSEAGVMDRRWTVSGLY